MTKLARSSNNLWQRIGQLRKDGKLSAPIIANAALYAITNPVATLRAIPWKAIGRWIADCRYMTSFQWFVVGCGQLVLGTLLFAALPFSAAGSQIAANIVGTVATTCWVLALIRKAFPPASR